VYNTKIYSYTMNKMQSKFRDNGATGALLDAYEKSINELHIIIDGITPKELTEIVDSKTDDEDCRSIQTILNHVIRSGYGYARTIRNWLGEDIAPYIQSNMNEISDYQIGLSKMFSYNEKLFDAYPDIKLESYKAEEKMLVSWGQLYDVEQLLEHAIVHVLRHSRQIERFKIKLREG